MKPKLHRKEEMYVRDANLFRNCNPLVQRRTKENRSKEGF